MTSQKYHAQPTTVDGIRFASKKEARRWQELQLLVRGGIIKKLVRQPSFEIVVNGHAICRYIADFSYVDRDGVGHVEDVKGVRTPVYRLKAKLVRAVYNIIIEEI